MPMIQLEESNYSGVIPDDTILPARLNSVQQKKMPWQNDDGTDVYKMEFAFTVNDPNSNWDGNRLWGNTSTKFNTHPDCKLYAWSNELLGTELEPGFQLDTDDLVGSSCRVVVGLREYEKDGEKKQRNFVKDVMRPKDGTAYQAAEPAYADEPF